MTLIELFFITNIIVLFPITIYIITINLKEKFNIQTNNSLFEIIIFIIVFLLIYLYYKFKIKIYICFFTIPIIISLFFDKKYFSFYLSLIELLFFYKIFDINILIPLLLIIIYFLIYNKLSIINNTDYYFINIYIITTTIFIFMYSIIFKSFSINFFIIMIEYILSSYLIMIYIIKLKELLKIYPTLKEIEEDEKFKTSIFKVTHEIKNPLAVIKGYLSIFDSNDNEKCERYKNILLKEVDNALLVLKDFSEINHLKINKQKMNINELLLDVKNTIIPFLNTKKIKCYIECENNIDIEADYNRLKQVLINIIKNSTEALDNNGIINIKTYKYNKNIIINIKDNGCGMDKDTIDNLFTPFYSKKSFGTGLGLCLSKEIIESHGGLIKYNSVLNKYTIVKITIPV